MSLYLGSEKVENVTAQITLPVEPSDDLPLADGTASAGVSKKFSRADHVHPAQEIPVKSVNGKTGAVSLTASDLNSVPITRTINSKALSSNIVLNASDVGAISSTLTGTAGQVLTKTASGQEWKDAASPQPSTTTPLAPTEAGSIGASDAYARGDHVHPSEMITLTGNMYEGNDGVTTEATYTSIKSLLTKYKIIQFELNYHESTNDKKLFFNTLHINGNPEEVIFSGAEKGGNDNYNCLNFIIFSSASSTVEFKSYSTMTEDGLSYFYKPTARKITLTTSGWSNNQQTVTCTGVSSNATNQEIRVMPADASKTSAYVSCGVSCVAQASNSLTFACDKVPTTAIDVYAVMQSLNFQN